MKATWKYFPDAFTVILLILQQCKMQHCNINSEIGKIFCQWKASNFTIKTVNPM